MRTEQLKTYKPKVLPFGEDLGGAFLQAALADTLFNSTQVDSLRAIALLCPYTYGPAVYQARAIIHAYDSVYVNYRNACEAFSAPIVYARGLNQEETTNDDNIINNNIEAETLYSQVYPNPTTNAFNVAILTNIPQNVSVSVYNMMGELIETQETVTNAKVISFNLKGYAQGLYLCKITNQNGEVLETKKVFIQHD